MPSPRGSALHVGRFVPWSGGCLLIGRAGDVVPLHAHYATQIAFGSASGIRFRADERDPWREYAGAVIPSRLPHAMDATHVQPSAVLLVEPETREGRALAARYGRDGIAAVAPEALAEVAPALFDAWAPERDPSELAEAARRTVRALAGGVAPVELTDERLLRAVRYVHAHLDAALSLDVVAGEACLSPSRFRHLFVEQTGMALRPYILWRRMLRVWELLTEGASLSAAAHQAGFADAAHLSRTSRSMFGFPPSAIHFDAPTAAHGAGATTGDR